MKSKLLRKGIAALSVLAMTAQLGFAIPAGAQTQNAVGGDAGASAELSETEALNVQIGAARYEMGFVIVPVLVTGDGEADINVFVAEYDKNGVMTKSHVKSKSMTAGSTNISVPFVDEENNASKVVAYTWDSNMKSYAEAQTVIDRELEYAASIEDDAFTANDNPTVMVSSISRAVDEDDNLIYIIKGMSYGAEVAYKTGEKTTVYNAAENAPLFNSRRYNYQKVWSAGESAQDDFANYVRPGDVFVLSASGSTVEGMMRIGDSGYIAKEKKPVWGAAATGSDASVAVWQSAVSLTIREGWIFGRVSGVEYDQNVIVGISDPVTGDKGSDIAFDASKPLNLCEVYLDNDGSIIDVKVLNETVLVDELIPYNSETGKGDLIMAKAHRGTLKDIYVYRVENKTPNIEVTLYASDAEIEHRDYEGYQTFGEAVFGTKKLYTVNPKSVYTISENAKVKVNGVKVPDDKRAEALSTFIADNPVGDINLVDYSLSDGVYDEINISYHLDGIVSAVLVGSSPRLLLYEYQRLANTGLTGLLKLGDSKTMITSADGTPIGVADIRKDDIISVEYDVVNHPTEPSKSSFIRIKVCRDTISGRVTTLNDDNKLARYEIDGTEYALSKGMLDELIVGNVYNAKLNAYGRIVEADDISTIQCGIIDKVYFDENNGDNQIKLVTQEGKIEYYIPKNYEIYNAANDMCYNADGSRRDISKRTVVYRINSRGELSEITAEDTIYAEGAFTTGEMIGSGRIDKNAVILDISVDTDGILSSDEIAVMNISQLEVDKEYKVAMTGRSTTGTAYKFVVILNDSQAPKPINRPIENDSFTANDNPTVMVSSISQEIDGDDNLVYLIKGISYGGEFVYKTMSTTAVYNTTENAPLFNLKKYNYQKVWSAEEYIQDDIYNYVKPGDVFVLKSTGSIIEGMVKIGDADYITHNRKPVWTGKDSSVASWQSYSLGSREGWLFGLVGDITYGDEARVNMLDPVSLDMGSTVAIDSSKIFNLCEVYLGSGNDIRTRVSKDAITADDLIPYDPQTGEGDLILAKAHRSSLKDVYVYRIGSKIVDYKTEFKAEDISFDEKAYTDYNSFGEAVLGTQKLYVRNPHNEEYSLNKDVQVSVNGVIVPAEERVKALNSFIADNPAGDVTLVDVAETDGVYDRIEISYHLDAVALSAAESGEMYKIILDKYQSLNGVSLSTIMSISKNKNISVSLADGTPMSITDIQEGDVLSVEYDVVNYPGDVNNSEFFRITVCRDTVNGKVTSFDRTGSVGYYEIDGNKYALSQGLIDSLEIGANYAAKLDVYGRIVEAVNTDDMTIKNGIVDRVYINNTTEEQLIEVVQENGSIGTYPARKDEVYNNALALCYNADGSKKDISERVVSYKMNSRGEISIINSVEDTVKVSDVYYANAKRIGNYKIGSDSVIVIEDTDGSISSDEVLSGDVSLLTDGEAYEVLMAGKSNADASYRFIVILGGFTGIGMKSPLAAVDSYSLGVDEEGNTVYRLGLIGQGMSILTDLYVSNEVDEAAVTALKKGDLITYSLNGAGMINSFKTVFGGVNGSLDNTPENMYKDYAINASDNVSGDEEAWEQTFYNMPDKISVPERWSKSLTTDRKGFVRVAFGPVVGKGADYIELAKVLKDGDTYYTPDNDIFRLNYGTNTNIMVCDFGESRSQRIQSGSNGSIIKTTLPRAVKDNNGTIYWQTPAGSSQESISSLGFEQYYAFVKMVDYEVTDIYFIAPNVY